MPHRTRWTLAVIGLVAFLARLLPVVRGGGLGGIPSYDDGVYFGAAESFVFGRLPYRDFVLLHPPGIVLALTPFAELARWTTDIRGLAAAQIAFMCVGAANAVLVYLVGRRIGPVAGLVGGLFYALWAAATYTERTALLEPLVNLGLLLGLLCIGDLRTTSRRRAVVGGAALGLAAAVKIWAVVPLIVLALWMLGRAGPRRALAFLGGSAGAAVLVCGPFFLAAPRRMLQLVVIDQLGRPNNGVSTTERLVNLGDVHLLVTAVSTPMAMVALLLVACTGLLSVWIAVADDRTRPWVSLLALQAVVLLLSPSYFPHYAAFLAPALALVVGATAGRAFSGLRAHAPSLRPVAATAMAAGLAIVGTASQLHPEGHRGPVRAVRAALNDAQCVTGDSPASLIATDVLARDLRRGCPVIVDVTGLTYTQDAGDLAGGSSVVARAHDVEWQHELARYLLDGDAVVVERGNPDGLDPTTLARLSQEELLLQARNFVVYQHSPARPPGVNRFQAGRIQADENQADQNQADQIQTAGLARTSRTTTRPAPRTADPARSVAGRTETVAH